MKYPKLKNALLCRILIYVVVIGMFILPIIIVSSIPFIPKVIKLIFGFVMVIGLIFYILKNFAFLIAMDMVLALQHAKNKSRKNFVLRESFNVENIQAGISHFGKGYMPTAITPKPDLVQYKSTAPAEEFSGGIERVILTYRSDNLNTDEYRAIIRSATSNFRSLKGAKKHLLLDKNQKKSPIDRVAVIIIFAKQVENGLQNTLPELVCKNYGDGWETAILPCVVNLEKRICIFDSMKIPYLGFKYPVKNRGIHLIKRYLFNYRLTLSESPASYNPDYDLDPQQSLWDFWKQMKKEFVSDEAEMKKRFEKMGDGDISSDDGWVYVKIQDRGICVPFDLNDEMRTVEIDLIEYWDFPKKNQISKVAVKRIKDIISTHFASQGYSVKFVSGD